eukprot:Rmarinus@m.10919
MRGLAQHVGHVGERTGDMPLRPYLETMQQLGSTGEVKVAFLFDYGPSVQQRVFSAVVIISISNAFPQTCPSICLKSVNSYDEKTMEPISYRCEGYPYSPRWSSHELCERIRQYLIATAFPELRQRTCKTQNQLRTC